MHIDPTMPGLKLLRTYPQPDSPQLGGSARNRALAVFKYLLNAEPEAAIKHPLFACIEHSFAQQSAAAKGGALSDSLIPEVGMGEIKRNVPASPDVAVPDREC